MFGDISTREFAGLQAVVLGALLVALVGAFGLYALGLPVEASLVAFLVLLVGVTVLSIPLWRRVAPRSEHADRE